MIKGIFPPIPTPFAGGEIAFERLRENLQKWLAAGIRGIVALGSNGEAVYLSRSEKLRLLEFCRENLPADRLLIAGTGCESIRETVELTNDAANCGATAALVVTPSYYRSQMDDAAMRRFYCTVADAAKIPLLIYNVPKFTGINIAAETVAALAAHPNIVGIKNSSENLGHLGEIIHGTPDDFSVLVGTASVLYPGLCLGASGGILALANVAPAPCLALYTAVRQNRLPAAREMQLKLIALNKAVTATYGIAGLKAALDILGYYGGPPRPPLGELDSAAREKLQILLREAGLC